ncbi:MAG: hypothetical protein AABY15_06905 [Nanoarchaeota archaeon]
MKMNELLKKVREAAQGIQFNDRTKYIAVCKVSVAMIKQWEKNPLPESMKGEKPNLTIFLIPEISHRLGQREEVQNSVNKLVEKLGEGFEGRVCPTKSEFILQDDNYICDF